MAQVITRRIQRVNAEVMQQLEMRVTLSMGVAAFTHPPFTVDDLLKTSDALMYSAKKNGKNTIYYGPNNESPSSQESGLSRLLIPPGSDETE
jgi:diguanylate cyclase (GGDEF)-like protein